MNQLKSPLEQVNWIGKLADLKDHHYEQTLLLHALIDLLVDKNIISMDELNNKVSQLDEASLDLHHPKL